MGEEGYTNFAMQYWYVILTLGIGLVLIVLFNLIAFLYFSRRQPIDPIKLFSDLEQDPIVEEIPEEQPDFVETTYETLPIDRTPTPENGDLNQFRMDALASHNEYRERHNAPPLQYSEELSVYILS
jgi:hypothetical protein